MKTRFATTVSPTERFLNALAFLLILSQLALFVGSYSELPATIPVHFGTGGKPDRWGGRGNLLVAPGVSVFLFLLFWAIRQVPAEYFNQTATVTPENRERLRRNTGEMLAVLSFVLMVFMTWTFWNWLLAAGNPGTTNPKLLPTVLLLVSIAGITLFYLIRAYRRV
ncbi:hypothetical protein GCM10027299_00480 [Larkinella ripae]